MSKTKKFYAFLLIPFIFWNVFACTSRDDEILSVPDYDLGNQNVILFVGDSLTEGYGLSKKDAYPAILEAYWQENQIPFRVRNAGITGDTTAGVLKRIDSLLTEDVYMVFLAIGANDGLRNYPLEQIRDNLHAIIAKIRSKNIPIAFVGMKLPFSPQMGYATQYAKVFEEVAQQNDLTLMPFLLKDVAGRGALNQDDRIHPNEKGQKVIAKNVLKFLNSQWDLP